MTECSMSGFSTCLIILDIWHGFEYASVIKYAAVLNMLWYSYNIITVSNIVMLEFLSASIRILVIRVRRYKNNESLKLLILASLNENFLKYFFS